MESYLLLTPNVIIESFNLGITKLLDLTRKSTASHHNNGNHEFLKLELQPKEFDSLVNGLIDLLPDHYLNPNSIAQTLEKLGKSAAAEKLRIRIPETKKTRSGDVGEVLATDYIEEQTDYIVPIRKLHWRDHRNMAMRGDDVIGIIVNPQNQALMFLKAEAKANQKISRDVLDKARKELDSDDGKPTPHALSFISERLIETGNSELGDLIEKALLVTGISKNQVKHLLFTVTKSNPLRLQKEAFDNYTGTIPQISIGVQVDAHQKLISSVYHGILKKIEKTPLSINNKTRKDCPCCFEGRILEDFCPTCNGDGIINDVSKPINCMEEGYYCHNCKGRSGNLGCIFCGGKGWITWEKALEITKKIRKSS